MAHVVQPLTSKDKNATLSIDGFGAYDFISGRAMFHTVADMPAREQLSPFMEHVHDEPFMRLGGGDLPMPFCLGQPFLDDIYVVCAPKPGKTFEMTGINIHFGKTKPWNGAGVKLEMADAMTAARAVKREAVVWRLDPQLPSSKQGLTVLGASGPSRLC